MRRRALLAAVGTTSVAGCTSALPTLCARPSFRADRLDFETRPFPSVTRWWNHRGTILATEPAHVERFEPPDPEDIEARLDADLSADERRTIEERALSADERTFVEDTDFEESILVGVLVPSANGSTDLSATHVVDEDRYVHCYVCIRRKGMDDVLAPQARLIRVHDSWDPRAVRVTFTDGNESTETFESDGTGADILGR